MALVSQTAFVKLLASRLEQAAHFPIQHPSVLLNWTVTVGDLNKATWPEEGCTQSRFPVTAKPQRENGGS